MATARRHTYRCEAELERPLWSRCSPMRAVVQGQANERKRQAPDEERLGRRNTLCYEEMGAMDDGEGR